MFERCLVDNLKHQLKELGICRVHRVRGRIWIDRADGGINADCRSVAVGYDFLRQESFPLKKEWRAKMEEYLRQE